MTISAIVLAVTNVFRGEGGPTASALSLLKDERASKKLVNKLAIALKRFAGKAVEALFAIVGSILEPF